MLARMTQSEQEQQESPFGPLTQNRSPHGRGKHQDVGVKTPLKQTGKCVGGDVVSPKNIG